MSKIPKKNYGRQESVNPEWLRDSEDNYNINLPDSYKWFLLKYDFIKLWGEMTKTVFPPHLQKYSDQDIFNYYHINESKDKLVFLITEELEEYYFKVVDNKVYEEVYTYNYIDQNENLISNDFISFLIREIPRNYL